MQEFSPLFPHETRIRIPMSMVDPGNVVYHSRYLDLYHEARDRYMDAAGYDYGQLMDTGFHLAVVDARVHFRRPVRYLETAIIRTRIACIRNRSMRVVQDIHKEIQGKRQLCNTVEMSLVCIGPRFTATSIPQNLVDTLARFQAQAKEV
ncbi:thioesterase family protein [Desulfobotulus sp.]|jgi:YbgC/YbaW family acyl-CoA thioester hydrolase|uniref:acyl-CoA thioesterase n=1 Tax=Desulfobotulus sp. TaxID=1940337 RepID=UPI002A35E0A9|nr:thioesterase family protein [Desulfobotulus sp.]MDY0162692.1 thioesterase family protein [Desulfobotulus sp.]